MTVFKQTDYLNSVNTTYVTLLAHGCEYVCVWPALFQDVTIHCGCSALKWNEHVLETCIKADQALLAPSFFCINYVFMCVSMQLCICMAWSLFLSLSCTAAYPLFLTINAALIQTLASPPILAAVRFYIYSKIHSETCLFMLVTSIDRISQMMQLFMLLNIKTAYSMIPGAVKL